MEWTELTVQGEAVWQEQEQDRDYWNKTTCFQRLLTKTRKKKKKKN